MFRIYTYFWLLFCNLAINLSFWYYILNLKILGKTYLVFPGKVDSWKTQFTPALNQMFDELYNKEMEDFAELKSNIQFEWLTFLGNVTIMVFTKE